MARIQADEPHPTEGLADRRAVEVRIGRQGEARVDLRQCDRRERLLDRVVIADFAEPLRDEAYEAPSLVVPHGVSEVVQQPRQPAEVGRQALPLDAKILEKLPDPVGRVHVDEFRQVERVVEVADHH